jgi:hypothetical protein
MTIRMLPPPLRAVPNLFDITTEVARIGIRVKGAKRPGLDPGPSRMPGITPCDPGEGPAVTEHSGTGPKKRGRGLASASP